MLEDIQERLNSGNTSTSRTQLKSMADLEKERKDRETNVVKTIRDWANNTAKYIKPRVEVPLIASKESWEDWELAIALWQSNNCGMPESQKLTIMYDSAEKQKSSNFHYWRVFDEKFKDMLCDGSQPSVSNLLSRMKDPFAFNDREKKMLVKKEWASLISKQPHFSDTPVILFRKTRKLFDKLRSYGDNLDIDDLCAQFLSIPRMKCQKHETILYRSGFSLEEMENALQREFDISIRENQNPTRPGLRGYKNPQLPPNFRQGKNGQTKRVNLATSLDESGNNETDPSPEDEGQHDNGDEPNDWPGE